MNHKLSLDDLKCLMRELERITKLDNVKSDYYKTTGELFPSPYRGQRLETGIMIRKLAAIIYHEEFKLNSNLSGENI